MGDWVNVTSSNISCVKYDEDNNVLTVRFNSGAEYEYYDVYSDDYYNLISAPSCGSFLNHNIKGKYRYEKIY